ncbi:MAG TPA: hypothetical protein VM537_36570 [Anaerolineae bacterium]|nr:hypothetical protein [Anaerolineae bacterium]
MIDEKALTTLSPLAVMPVMEVAQAIARRQAVAKLVKTTGFWVDGTDSGTIPGTDKPTLLKPGAEKLCSFFGLSPKFLLTECIEDWTGAEHGGEALFYYQYTCQLWRGDLFVAEAGGSCNSWESKYRYRWVDESDVPEGMDKSMLKKRGGKVSEFKFSVDKAETAGKYGKPSSYWQRFKDAIANDTATTGKRETRNGKTYETWEIDCTVYRIPNDDVTSQVNTVQKMAQKRALVAVALLAINASEFFTQDLEDFSDGPVVNGTARVVESETEQAKAPAAQDGSSARPQGRGLTPDEQAKGKRDPDASRLNALRRRVMGALAEMSKLYDLVESTDDLYAAWKKQRWHVDHLAEIQAEPRAVLDSISSWAQEYADRKRAPAAQEAAA